MGGIRYLLAQLALPLLGLGMLRHPSVGGLSLLSRLSLAFMTGAVLLTLEAELWSVLGVRWTLFSLGLPLVALHLVPLAVRRSGGAPAGPAPLRRSTAIAAAAALTAAALAYAALSFASASATSADYLLFWGVKAVRFAVHGGIDPALLRDPFFGHATPDYPPLVPVVQAWGCLGAGRMPWRVAPLASLFWLVAAIPVVFDRSRRRLADLEAAALATFWTVALSISLVYSYSGGNAEVPLLCFETVGLAWLLTEQPGDSRLVPMMALAGAALTKVEGLIGVAGILAGMAVTIRGPERWRDLRRLLLLAAAPAAAVGTWFAYQAWAGLVVGYRAAHGPLLALWSSHVGGVVPVMLRNLDAGSLWAPWMISLAAAAAVPSAWRRLAPAFFLCGGILLFLLFDYLHDPTVPEIRIGWTIPRVSQSALSALILAGGLAWLSRGARSRASGSTA
jgi:hypothetical protein